MAVDFGLAYHQSAAKSTAISTQAQDKKCTYLNLQHQSRLGIMESTQDFEDLHEGGAPAEDETPEKLLLAGFEIDWNTVAGLAFTALCGLFIIYLVVQRRSEAAQLKESYSYEKLRSKNLARTQRLSELQKEQDRLAEEERQRRDVGRLEKQRLAQAVKAKRQVEELQGGHRLPSAPIEQSRLPRQAAEPTQRQVEMRQIEQAFQQAMAKDVQLQSAVAAAAEAEEQLLAAALSACQAADMEVSVLPAKLARRSITATQKHSDIMVMVRTLPADSGGVRHVTVKCAASSSMLAFMGALHAVLPGRGVLGKVLVQAHPRKQLADGNALRGALLGGGDAEAPGGALQGTLADAGVANRAMLMLRSEDDA